MGPAWRSTWTASHTLWLWTGSRPVMHTATSVSSLAAKASWPTTPQSPSWESVSWSVDLITQWKWCPTMEPVSVYPQCCLSGKVRERPERCCLHFWMNYGYHMLRIAATPFAITIALVIYLTRLFLFMILASKLGELEKPHFFYCFYLMSTLAVILQ